MSFLDSVLTRFTMYRLMLYYLVFLVVFAVVFSGFSPVLIVTEALFLTIVCYLSNKIFAKIFGAPTNFESFAITALILSLIIGPTTDFFLLAVAAIVAMAGKYFLVIGKRHVFNPAALAVVATAVFGQPASWWVGSDVMVIPLFLGGFLILRKIRRFSLVLTFLFLSSLLSRHLPTAPLLFFALVMLIEPLTSPVLTKFQIVYAALVALLFPTLPLELSLLAGNLFSYLSQPTIRVTMRLAHKLQLAPNVHAFLFKPEKEFPFTAGQYLEWTLPHKKVDNRGIRRFFTIASSPTEPEIMLVSKFADTSSSFKNALLEAKPGDQFFANGPAGEFTLPKNPHLKLAFIAGGIGITPFRSMVKYLLDTNESRNIILLYTAASEQDFVFKDLFLQAIYKVGRLEIDDIKKGIPDFQERIFYVSGPEPMVQATEKLLAEIGIRPGRINRDYFPGYV